VTVSAPPRTSEAQIAAFVAAKADWIRRHQARIAALPPRSELRYETGEEHRFLGLDLQLEVRPATGRRPGAEAVEERLLVHARDPHDRAEVKRHLDRLYHRELQARLDELVPAWSARLGVATQTVRIRAMKRKWGACRPQRRDIVFNLELAKQPPAAIDYVVLHELAHLLEPSHGPRFQAILSEHMPDWRAVETALNGRVTTR
jgi:predicted metal-dependent hydrolase